MLYYSNTTNLFAQVLDSICESDLFLLWIKPKECYLNQSELRNLLEALDTFKCILWFITSGSDFSSQRYNDSKRAFGGQRSLSSNVFRKKEYFLNQTKYYSDLSILTSSEVEEGEKFCSRGLFGYDSIVAFTQSLDSDFSEFDNLASLWLTRLQESPIRRSQTKLANIAKYVHEVIQKKGIPGLVVEDTECCKSLILLSKEEATLKQVFTKLQVSDHFQIVSDSTVSNFIKRGVSLTV